MANVIVTGVAGFIGMHTAKLLLEGGHSVLGVDNLNDYYDVSLKKARLKQLDGFERFMFIKADLADWPEMNDVFSRFSPEFVVHLAAQAGVRYSIQNPQAYIHSNVLAFTNIMEAIKSLPVKHFVYASSSSVYGSNAKIPFSEDDPVENPVSVYAATKKSNELMAHVYAHQYGLKVSGLRFFTVYGPWGRPDMAPMIFANALKDNKPITLFNNGDHERDFTYIDDIVNGVVNVLFQKNIDRPLARVYNIGASKPVHLRHFVSVMEERMNAKAHLINAPMQPGDVKTTYADVSLLKAETGYEPMVGVEEGVARFVAWFKDFYCSSQ